MKISISEARKRLPELLRRVREGGDAAVRITVHDEVVAELRPVLPEPEPGMDAHRLLELMDKLPKHKGPKKTVSENVKAHLYGRGGVSR